MNRNRCLIPLLFLVFFIYGKKGISQEIKKYTLSGTVQDANTKEPLIGANIYIVNMGNGVAADINGNYRIKVTEGTVEIRCSFVGYEPFITRIQVKRDINLDFKLDSKKMLREVEVTAKREDENVKSVEGSRVELSIAKIEKIPVLFGEPDILKTIQLLPGIQSGGEGSNSFYVRGGGPDQNLILIDNATVYNASHMAGFFSVFNSGAISSAEVIKGGMPAEYGSRLSSILNITAKDGDMKKYSAELGVGMISSWASIDGPIIKDKLSFQISGRRTYIDLLLGLFEPFMGENSFAGAGYFFYDVNGKLFWRISENDNLSFTTYMGDDYLSFEFGRDKNKVVVDWGNRVNVLNWNHITSEKLFFNTSAHYTTYQFSTQLSGLDIFSGVKDWSLKSGCTYEPDSSNKLKGGVHYTYHIFSPNSLQPRTTPNGKNDADLYGHELAFYLQHEWDLTKKIKVNYGLRYTYFAQLGPFTRYRLNDQGNIFDSTLYSGSQKAAGYQGLEPRLNLLYKLGKVNSIKASYTYNKQYVGLASLSTISLPTDIWFPSTEISLPQTASQISLGYFHNLMNNEVEISAELYYKEMKHLFDYRDGILTNIASRGNFDYDFTFGKGKSYGVEFFINKTQGKFSGWIGYTLSWTKRTFSDINDGKEFYARYDRRHDISILGTYELNTKWIFSAVWVYASGAHMTLPSSYYFVNGQLITEYGDRNAWTMPSNHRLDLSATWKFFEKKHVMADLNFSVYNAYSRMNPYFIDMEVEGNLEDGDMKVIPTQVSLFPIIPSISLVMKFR